MYGGGGAAYHPPPETFRETRNMAKLEFWYEFASTYSYLSAMRIEALAAGKGIEIAWKPFLLGPIFQAQGWQTSPFNLYPNKGRYMVRDIERIAQARGLTFKLAKVFPQNGLKAARLAMVGAARRLGAGLHPRNLSAAIPRRRRHFRNRYLDRGAAAGGTGPGLAASADPGRGGEGRVQGPERQGARSRHFRRADLHHRDGELFWGDDRLESALDWASARVAA